jgi:hypothetical protein
MHDLSLSAIMSSPAGMMVAPHHAHSHGRGPVAGSASNDLPPLVADVLAQSAATRKRIEELQMQQVVLQQSHQALEASVRHLTAASSVAPSPTAATLATATPATTPSANPTPYSFANNMPFNPSFPTGSSFINTAATTAASRQQAPVVAPEAAFIPAQTTATRHPPFKQTPSQPQSQQQAPHSISPGTPPLSGAAADATGPSFFLYSDSEPDVDAAHQDRMMEAQLAMQQQQLQRSALIAQQDAVLQQQQQLLLHNASQLVQSMSGNDGGERGQGAALLPARSPGLVAHLCLLHPLRRVALLTPSLLRSSSPLPPLLLQTHTHTPSRMNWSPRLESGTK